MNKVKEIIINKLSKKVKKKILHQKARLPANLPLLAIIGSFKYSITTFPINPKEKIGA